MTILKKNIKILLTVFILLGLSFNFNPSNAASGSSGSDGSDKTSLYKSGKKLGMKIAAEIFADRNYEDDGNLVSRSKENAMIIDPEIAQKHVIKMVESQALNCYSGKQIPCEIDSVCVHGDEKSAVNTAKQIKEGLIKSGVTLNPLDKMKKFV